MVSNSAYLMVYYIYIYIYIYNIGYNMLLVSASHMHAARRIVLVLIRYIIEFTKNNGLKQVA